MKPAPQTSSTQKSSRSECDRENVGNVFPIVDYSYQPSAEVLTAPAVTSTPTLPAFHSLSREIFESKTSHEYIKEAILFASITCVAAWPVSVMLHQLATMMISPPAGGIW